MSRSLDEWLHWQESLHPQWMDLGLERTCEVARRLSLDRPAGAVFTVAGTNGKGSTVALLEQFLIESGRKVGAYTSPHLLRYNERIRVGGGNASDAEIVEAFERVESARGITPLTFFEFGTLAALEIFRQRQCNCWVLEVGLGGRLDAVNVIDPDFSLITTVALDHEEYLGSTVEEIAREKAGILRSGRPGFYGDSPMPATIRDAARECGAILRYLDRDFSYTRELSGWSWRGERNSLAGLPYPPAATDAQLRNCSLVLAGLEQYEESFLRSRGRVDHIIASVRPPGRFQIIHREHEWILDVAHNPQAAATLSAQLATLPAAETTFVLGMLGDKKLEAFVTELRHAGNRWITCTVDDRRALAGSEIAARLEHLGLATIDSCADPEDAFRLAQQMTGPGARIVVCGSFRVVGPALQWLRIY